jgi:hypothetical protein
VPADCGTRAATRLREILPGRAQKRLRYDWGVPDVFILSGALCRSVGVLDIFVRGIAATPVSPVSR